MKCYINNLENNKHIYYFILPSMIRIDNNQINVKIIGESEYRKIKKDSEKSKNNIDSCFIDPKFSFESDCKNLNLSYSIGTFILKYHLNFNNDEIKDFFKNNKQIPNKQVSDLLKMAFDIKTFNSIDFLNELEQFINEIDESGFKENPNLDSTVNKNIKEDFSHKNRVERSLHIEESSELIIKNKIYVKENKNDQINEIPKCPYCLVYVIIEGGCDFITCNSNFCKGKKYFCKVCNKKLLISDKVSHFPQGMFNNSCKNIY